MTEKLYYTQPKCSEWETSITHITQEDDYYLVTLKETAFYPEGGGQPADQGFIDHINVIDVIEKDHRIYHKVLTKPSINRVTCKIDDHRRFDHTQQHTGQHLLSAVLIELFDIETVSFHLGTDTVTIDINTKEITDQQILEVEQKVNQYIYDDIEIKTYFVQKDELSSLQLRKTPSVTEDIRIVEIKGIDVSACCGTHVIHTGQLGLIKIVKTEKVKGNTRVHFKCGYRALEDYRQTSTILNDISHHLSSNREAVLSNLKKLELEHRNLQKELEEVKEKNNQFLVQQLLAEHPEKVISLSFTDRSLKDLQSLSRHFVSRVVVFQSLLDKKLLLSHDGLIDFHCGQFFKEHLKQYHGKGGGNALSSQASFDDIQDLEQFAKFTESAVIEKMAAVNQ
ncbi:alanyl-tRNA editing protein [Litchfieldia alkalitelluris]|uniref:alanyl-tRNA editing protein n=1 Tax=Litchfieldia alkalitelluris TaxID=304268 RepID=UPI000996E008|nr:alanyl-tRNA editing protein [Litchfieldia alkalitelluris]